MVGREKEIRRILEILCRRTKNNPLLIGDAGVGKTAIVEELSRMIVEGTVPDILKNKKYYRSIWRQWLLELNIVVNLKSA